MITQNELKERLDYDPETGIFRWKNPYGKAGAKELAGCINSKTNGMTYIILGIHSEKYFAHRLAWLYVHGEFPLKEIDHINGNGKDNRLINLREVTHLENKKNSKKYNNN